MNRRLVISVLFATSTFFLGWMSAIESNINAKLKKEPIYQSFAKNLELPCVNQETINTTITAIQKNDAFHYAKEILFVDFGFMLSIYPLIAFCLFQLLTVYDPKKYAFFKLIAYLQIVAFLADVVENITLLKSIQAGHLLIPIATYHVIEYCKWGIALIGGGVILIAFIEWIINFLIHLKKA